MSFIRPEARAALWRWREVMAGAALAVLGLSWAIGPGGLLGLVGWAVVVCGAGLALAGFQRARFRGAQGGPGVVLVDEGEITYLGPLTGGSVSLAELERLVLDPTAKPPHWVLDQPGQPTLQVPVNAEGADDLFDVFATLPGLRTERMLAQLRGRAIHPVVIWERRPLRPPTHWLH